MAEQMRMPASFGGLTRYFEEYKSKLEIKPSHVIFLIIIVILFEFIIRVL